MIKKDRIRIGNQTAFSASYTTEPFEYAVETGFDAFEWFPDRHENGGGWDEESLDTDTRRYIRDTAAKYDIALSVHAPLDADPITPEKRERLYKTIEFAGDIGATLLNIHLNASNGIDAYVKAIMPIMKDLADNDMGLSIENTPLTGPEEFNKLFSLLKKVTGAVSEDTGMCFDLGHANLQASTRNDYISFMDRLDSHIPITHVHMHENYGDFDSHLPIFTGPAAYSDDGIRGLLKRLIQRGFSGSIILEQWPEPLDLLDHAHFRLCCIFNSILKGKTSEKCGSL